MTDALSTDRISELKAKKSAKTITPSEKMELQGLSIKQQKLRLQKKEAAFSELKRKADNALKFKLGGLVVSAGVGDWDEATLRGALLEMAAMTDPAVLVRWRDAGGAAYNDDIQKRREATVPLSVQFPEPPPAEISTALRAKALDWDEKTQRWRGFGILAEIEAIAQRAYGKVEATR